MKTKRLLCNKLLSAALASGMLFFAGCQADVDINKVDTTASLELGVALPIGAMSITLGDLLGSGTVDNLYYDNGTLCLHADYYKHEAFHPMDLSQYIGNADKTIPMYETYSAALYQMVPGQSKQFSVETDIELEYDGINDNLGHERIDSVYITHANVDGYLTQHNFPVPFEQIDKITLEFGKEFLLNEGRSYVLYDKSNTSLSNADYGTALPVDLQHFVLDLVKDHSLPASNTNVLNTTIVHVRIDFTLPANTQTDNLMSDMALIFGMKIRFLDYEAAWGMFDASSKMHDEDEIIMDSVFPNWHRFRDMRLPFADPRITMDVSHRLAGKCYFNGNYLYVRSQEGLTNYATFDGNISMRYPAEESAASDSTWMLPDASTMQDSVAFTLLFDKDESRGHIDQLFALQPDFLGWKFYVDFDSTAQQTRITPNTDVIMDIDMDIPFVFNEGIYLMYHDTMPNLNLNSMNLDSLSIVDSITTSDVYLKMQIENTLPLDIHLVLHCLDEKGNVLIDTNTGKALSLTSQDTIQIKAPSFTPSADGTYIPIEPGKTEDMLVITKQKYEDIDKIANIMFELILDDKSLQPEEFKKYNDFKVRITDDSKLKIRLGVGAKAGVILENFAD